MRVARVRVYKFEELSDDAKERARAWYREGHLQLYDWWDNVYNDFIQICGCLGIQIKQKLLKAARSKQGVYYHRNQCIYFSGFASQGDGASFEGTYSYRPEWKKRIVEYCPKDSVVYDVGRILAVLQKPYGGKLHCQIQQSGNYCHEHTMSVSDIRVGELNDIQVGDGDEPKDYEHTEEVLIDCFRRLAKWLYKTLEAEYDYLQSNEVVDEAITSNGYEFYSDGRRFVKR